jgi:hypothetical protein
MPRTPTVGSLLLALTALVVAPLGLPATAFARGHHGGGGVWIGVGGFYGWGPYWGWGAPYWGWGAPNWGWGWGPGPYAYGTPGGVTLGAAMMAGMGGLDLDVNPKQAEVWVDGKYVADARDLDGDPSYLWLKAGGHRLVLYKAGFRSFDENVEVGVGMVRQLKVRLERGESQPPARAVAAAPPESLRGGANEAPAAAPAEPSLGESNEAPAATEPPSGPTGDVRLRVEPRDATVYVDDAYRGTALDLPDLQLPAGHHRLELVRPGFRPLVQDFDVEADRTIDVHLAMEKEGGWKY